MRGPQKSRPFPHGQLFIPGRLLTVSGPSEAPRGRKRAETFCRDFVHTTSMSGDGPWDTSPSCWLGGAADKACSGAA
eukprot:6186408-Pyramimonas_sp.AAC.1